LAGAGGITILDGKFMTILPFGKTGRYLLYHVENVVIAAEIAPVLDARWRDAETSPFASLDKNRWFVSLLDACCQFVPDLGGARLSGFLHGPRMVLANKEATDARPSLVNSPEPRYITVFSGKIDHCTWVADEVCSQLGST
jgi:hypothetical protein